MPIAPRAALLLVVGVVVAALGGGCAPARAPVDAAAVDLAKALATAGAADAVAVDAAVFGYVRGARVRFTSGVDGNHDVVRADVDVDGVAGRLMAKLNADKTAFAVVAVLPEPKSEAEGPTPRGIARYGAAWNVDDDARAGALADGFAAAGDYVDPQVVLGDRGALADHIRAFRGSLPGARVDPTTGVSTAGRAHRFRWVTRGFGGIDLVEGEDLVVVDGDGRVELVCGFWDRDPPAL